MLKLIGATDKTMKLYKDGKHDILFEKEPMQTQAIQDVIAWLDSH